MTERVRSDDLIHAALVLARPLSPEEVAYIGLSPLPDEDPLLFRLRQVWLMDRRANGDPEDPEGDLASLYPSRDVGKPALR